MARNAEVTTPSAREIHVARTFDAPPGLLFGYYTDPALVKQWLLGPAGWTMPVCEIDLRAGGNYRYVWRNDETSMEFGVQGVFRTIQAPERIVDVQVMDGVPGEVICTTTFSESGDGTLVVLTLQYESEALRNSALASGMTDGMSMSYERLDTAVIASPRSV